MKKWKSLLAIVVCLTVLLTVTGCDNKKAITTSEFKSKMEAKNYRVEEVTSQFEQISYEKALLLL